MLKYANLGPVEMLNTNSILDIPVKDLICPYFEILLLVTDLD